MDLSQAWGGRGARVRKLIFPYIPCKCEKVEGQEEVCGSHMCGGLEGSACSTDGEEWRGGGTRKMGPIKRGGSHLVQCVLPKELQGESWSHCALSI